MLLTTFYKGWEERVEIALSEIVDARANYLVAREHKIPSNTRRLKELIDGLIAMLFKGDSFTSRNIHDANKSVSRESPPPGCQMKKNYTNPATEVIPEEEEDDSTTIKQNIN